MVSRSHRALVAAILLTMTFGRSSGSESTTRATRYARIVVIQPKPGQQQAFEDGYRKHLAWHRSQPDPWTWMGWSFVLGERLGLFLDGTFGHAAEDFDRAVDPAGDAADNARNVSPTADFVSHGIYERLDSLGSSTTLPDDAPFLALTTYSLKPGSEAAFERAITRVRSRPIRKGHPEQAYAWFRLVIGGSSPEYVLFRPVRTWSEAAGLQDFFWMTASETGAPTTNGDTADAVLRVRTELLRYRPEMSHHP